MAKYKTHKRKKRTRLDERAIKKWADNLKLTRAETIRIRKVLGLRVYH